MPNQPGYHKRLRAAAPLLAKAISHLARVSPSWCDSLRLLDATAVPCAASRETVRRSEITGSGGYGFCAARTRYYWGFKLYLLSAADGMPAAWCLADPKIGEREVCLDLLTIATETGLLAPGSTVLADKNLAGREIEGQISALGVRLLRPDRRDEPTRHGSLGGSGSGSSRSTTTSRASSAWNATAGAPRTGSSPASPSRCSPGRSDLAQLGHPAAGQALLHRLRPLTTLKESIIQRGSASDRRAAR